MGNSQTTEVTLQSIPLPGTAVAADPASGKLGSTAIYRSASSPDRLIDHIYEGITTVYHNFWLRGRVLNPNGPCLGYRPVLASEKLSGGESPSSSPSSSSPSPAASPASPAPSSSSSSGSASTPSSSSTSVPRFTIESEVGPYKWLSYAETASRIEHFASGLVRLGLKRGSHLGIFAINNIQWTIADQACYAQSMVTIALYDTFGQDAVEYIINEAKISTIVCTQDKIRSLFTASERCPGLKTIVQIEGTGDDALVQEAKDRGLELVNFDMVEANGALHPSPHDPPSADDLCTIMYTSGTTGMPKGVLLTHRCVIASLASVIHHGINLVPDDVHLSYLPLAHIFERLLQYAIFSAGASMGFYQGNVRDKLFDDIKELRPTIFASVPRLFSRVFDKISQRIETTGGMSKFLFGMAYNSKLSSLEEGADGRSSLWDGLVFQKTRESLGGRVRFIVTGSAPISSQLFRFLQICFSCAVLQGYGLTETSAGATLTHQWDSSAGHTGAVLPCCEIKLEDIPDMNYFSTDQPPRGEVCIRGPNVFHGYYEQPEKTQEAIDADGWFHTGDVGLINPNGTLTIIDRKKNIFKLSQGEYVAAEKIESCLLKNKYVLQIFVYGDSLKSCLVAVIVPDPDTLIPWAKAQAIPNAANLDAICRDENVIKHVLRSLGETGREWQFKGFEFIRAIHLEPEQFSIEKDLLTPTFKNKRPQLTNHYHQVFDELYNSISE